MRRSKRYPYYLISLLFSILFPILSSCSSLDTPESATKTFLALLKDGKHAEAQKHLSYDFKKSVKGYGGVKNETVKRYYREKLLKDYQILSVYKKTDSSARVRVQLTTSDGKLYSDAIDLVMEGGKWMIDKF